MDDRKILWLIVLITLLTLYAVVASSDGISPEESQTAAAFLAGGAVIYLLITGKRPKP